MNKFAPALLFCTVVLAEAPLEYYQKFCVVKFDTKSQEDLWAIQLSSEVYNQNSALNTLRLINDQGKEIPYILKKRQRIKMNKHIAQLDTRIISLKKNDDNTVEILVQNKDNDPASFLRVKSSVLNYDKTITIYGGQDLRCRKQLGPKQRIFDYSKIIDLSSDRIDIPANKYAFYKVKINNFKEIKRQSHELINEKHQGKLVSRIEKLRLNDAVFKIKNIHFYREYEQADHQSEISMEYPLNVLSRQTADKKSVFILQSKSEALSQITLSSESVNFSRQMTIEISDDREQWQHLISSRIQKIALGQIERTATRLSFNETRSPYYRITINNKDAPALKQISFAAEGPVYQVIFLPQEGNSIRLYYQADDATKGKR
ncbi:MAG: hypothetical protein HRT89_11685 [Lentisphaeria bacterium]|nr:hypothetical protein [Lentisphaeria bacterium]NQZ68717.1 hypothetical protein [Lentisphaeria bacterium]